MKPTRGGTLYVRMDEKIEGKDPTAMDFQEHLAYVERVAGQRCLWGGGFTNTDGGMILFAAGSLEDAQNVARKDPLIMRGFYQCEVFEWELVVLSEGVLA